MEKGHEIKVLDHGYVKFIDQMGSDEAVIEAARMSTNKGFKGWDTDAELLEYLYSHKHMTPFECGGELQIEVQAPIFIFRQWHRHRTQCLSGDTEIYFEIKHRYHKNRRAPYKIKLKNLYEKWQPTASKRADKQKNPYHKRDRVRNMYLRCLNEDTNVFNYSHINDVMLSGEKDVFEVELKSGKKIKCSADHKFLFDNGWGSLKDKIGLQLINDKAVYQNSKFFIETNGELGYKNKNWLHDKYHTKNMKIEDIASEFGYNYHTLRKWIKLLGLQKPNGFLEGKSNWWKGGTNLGVPKLVPKLDQIISITYVGKEMCYDLSVDGPFHNFVANGIVTHNSFNEMSARYTKMPDAHYLPESSRLTAQNNVNKQGSSDELLPLSVRNEFLTKMEDQQKDVYSFYSRSIKKNKLSKEIARINCPVSRYSKMRAKTDLRNWLHFLGLRMHPHAQWEIREYANAVAEIVKAFWPRTFELFEEHTLHSVTLSRTEVANLKKYIAETETPYVADEKSYIGHDPDIVEKIFKKVGFEKL